MSPKVPPIAVIIKMGAAVTIPFSMTPLSETGVKCSKRNDKSMPIPNAKLGEHIISRLSLTTFNCSGNEINWIPVPNAIRIIGIMIGAIAIPKLGSVVIFWFCASSKLRGV